MDMKEAIVKAKRHIADLFEEEKPANIGLEEVEHDDVAGEWRITIGFTRAWDRPKMPLENFLPDRGERTYKVVRIEDNTGQIRAINNRDIQN